MITDIAWSPLPEPARVDAVPEFPLDAVKVEVRRLSNSELLFGIHTASGTRLYRVKGLACVNFERVDP